MSGRVQGKAALITGAARGQGRAHALRLAEEGADIIVLDLCAAVEEVKYPPSTRLDLVETAALVSALGRRVVAATVDVRDMAELERVVSDAVAELGRLDIVCANAGIVTFGSSLEISASAWQSVLDINLTGVWHTVKATIPHLRSSGGGSIIITSSAAGLKGFQTAPHYTAAKHGVVGLMRALANELGPEGIRVNTINPTNVLTPMFDNPEVIAKFVPGSEFPTLEEVAVVAAPMHPLQVPWVEAVDVSHAVLFLASDEARYVTGVALPVDAGFLVK